MGFLDELKDKAEEFGDKAPGAPTRSTPTVASGSGEHVAAALAKPDLIAS